MVDRMMLAQALTAMAAVAFSAAVGAQALADPTRPPLELLGAAAGAAPRTPLQSILLSSARKGAIISGQYVPLGGIYGGARLVKITPTEVTLKSDRGLEVLQLYPAMDTPFAASGAGRKPEKTAKRP